MTGFVLSDTITVRFTSVGPDEVDCTISIEEGQRRRIEEVNIRFVRDLVDATTRDENLAPEWQCPRFSSRMLEKASGVDDIEVHTERTERTLKTNLTEFLQKHGIRDPRITAEFDKTEGRLALDIRYEYCHRIQFFVRSDHGPGESGFRFREPDGWRGVLAFGTSGTYDFNEAEYSRRLLESHLENEGFLFSETRLDYREVDPRRGPVGQVGTPVSGISTFMVTEGYITEIRKVEFEGMNHFDPDEIRDQLETQKYDFFGEGGYLQVQKFFVELKELQERYRADGYHRQEESRQTANHTQTRHHSQQTTRHNNSTSPNITKSSVRCNANYIFYAQKVAAHGSSRTTTEGQRFLLFLALLLLLLLLRLLGCFFVCGLGAVDGMLA